MSFSMLVVLFKPFPELLDRTASGTTVVGNGADQSRVLAVAKPQGMVA